MGQGDLHQPRLRSDFSAADYVQHKFRYFDARFLDSARGQRVAWALFNTALREQSRQTGHLVHKNSSEKALTLQELRDLVNSREDLVRKVATFGAEIPTTPMHWKKEGNHLEWIVRQMSWFPPWCFSDVHDARVAEPTRKRAKKEVAEIDGVRSEIHEAGRATEEDVKQEVEDTRGALAELTVADALPSDTESEVPVPCEGNDELNPASLPAGVPLSAKELDHRTLWHRGASVQTRDAFGYERNPAFWFTLNLPFNHLHEIHRFAHATEEAKKQGQG